MKGKQIFGLIIGEGKSGTRAEEYGRKMSHCPYSVFHAVEGRFLVSGYIVPARQIWWLGYPEVEPEKVGFVSARVFIGKQVYPLAFRPHLPAVKKSIAPCGACCNTCRLKKEYSCLCCPATVHYRGPRSI